MLHTHFSPPTELKDNTAQAANYHSIRSYVGDFIFLTIQLAGQSKKRVFNTSKHTSKHASKNKQRLLP
jgi:hypothetical protein